MENGSLNLNVDERNGKLLEMYSLMVAEKVIGVGDVVTLNALGVSAGLGEAGERFVVVRVDERWGKILGDIGRVVEMWCFSEEGELRKLVSDMKFLDVVETAASAKGAEVPKKKPTKKGAIGGSEADMF